MVALVTVFVGFGLDGEQEVDVAGFSIPIGVISMTSGSAQDVEFGMELRLGVFVWILLLLLLECLRSFSGRVTWNACESIEDEEEEEVEDVQSGN